MILSGLGSLRSSLHVAHGQASLSSLNGSSEVWPSSQVIVRMAFVLSAVIPVGRIVAMNSTDEPHGYSLGAYDSRRFTLGPPNLYA